MITIGRYKKQIKNILHRDKQKRDKKIQYKPYLTALSNRTVKKVRRGVDVRAYQNNGTENLFVVIIYLIEAFKIRLLLLIAESSESPKRSNSTFK